jgi:hypothetical protein
MVESNLIKKVDGGIRVVLVAKADGDIHLVSDIFPNSGAVLRPHDQEIRCVGGVFGEMVAYDSVRVPSEDRRDILRQLELLTNFIRATIPMGADPEAG